jgi:hypothetical protein
MKTKPSNYGNLKVSTIKQQPRISFTKETLINLSDRTLDDGVSSLLQKGLNYVVTPRNILIEDMLGVLRKQYVPYRWRRQKKLDRKQ